MSEPRVTSAAERDFTEALCWYAERSHRAAEGLDAEFNKALEKISVDPRQFPFCDERHRFYLMDRYPYQVIYREELGELSVKVVEFVDITPPWPSAWPAVAYSGVAVGRASVASLSGTATGFVPRSTRPKAT